MAYKTDVELKTQVDAVIIVNGNREITPPLDNSIRTNFIDSKLSLGGGTMLDNIAFPDTKGVTWIGGSSIKENAGVLEINGFSSARFLSSVAIGAAHQGLAKLEVYAPNATTNTGAVATSYEGFAFSNGIDCTGVFRMLSGMKFQMATDDVGRTLSLAGGAFNETVRIAGAPSSVNYFLVTGSAAAGDLLFEANGTDTDISIQYNAKGAGTHKFTGGVRLASLTATTVPYLDASKNLVSSAVTPTQLGYLDATSSIQTQLNTKVTTGGALGTPSSGVLTNCTGTASGLTAGTVTTNANLTGDVTSVGNATTIIDTFKTYTVKVSVSSAQILASGVTGITLVSAPGSGKTIQVLNILNRLNFVTTAYTTNLSWRYYHDTAVAPIAIDGEILKSTVSRIGTPGLSSTSATTTQIQIVENKDVKVFTSGGNPAAGDGTMDIYITYKIVTL
jgi:hypothetical protein